MKGTTSDIGHTCRSREIDKLVMQRMLDDCHGKNRIMIYDQWLYLLIVAVVGAVVVFLARRRRW
jgi:hypothetical protein